MATQQGTRPRGRSRVVTGVLAGVAAVVVVLVVLALTGVGRDVFAKQVDRTVRDDVEASGLVAVLATYPDSFRGSYLAADRVDLHVDIDQVALRDINLTAQPAFLALQTYSCPGADGTPALTRLMLDGADAEHVRLRPAEAGGGVSLQGAFEVVGVEPLRPGPVPECRVDLAAR